MRRRSTSASRTTRRTSLPPSSAKPRTWRATRDGIRRWTMRRRPRITRSTVRRRRAATTMCDVVCVCVVGANAARAPLSCSRNQKTCQCLFLAHVHRRSRTRHALDAKHAHLEDLEDDGNAGMAQNVDGVARTSDEAPMAGSFWAMSLDLPLVEVLQMCPFVTKRKSARESQEAGRPSSAPHERGRRRGACARPVARPGRARA